MFACSYFDAADQRLRRISLLEIETLATQKALIVQEKLRFRPYRFFRHWCCLLVKRAHGRKWRARFRGEEMRKAAEQSERAFCAWRDGVHRYKQHLLSVACLRSRRAARGRSAFFYTWMQENAWQKQRAIKYMKLFETWNHRCLYSSFCRIEQFCMISGARRRLVRDGGVKRATRCLCAWQDAARKTRLFARFQRHWRHVHSAKAFEVWHNGLVMRHRWEHASEMVMRRLDYGRTTMAWWRWAEEKRLRRIASKITLRWVNLAVWPAFRRWCGQGGEVKRLRRIASKITSRWAGLTVAPAWTRWCEYWGEEKRLRRIADKIVRTWQKSCLAIAWRTWTAQAAYTRACMVKIEKAVTRWHKTRTAEAWDRWAGEIEQGRMVEVSRKHCHWDDASARAHSFCCYAMT
jgi:hypothetical protein